MPTTTGRRSHTASRASVIVPLTVTHARLAAQYVTGPTLPTPRSVVAHMVAVQAQDLAAAKWAIGLRMRHAHIRDVDRAIERGAILRTWPMRGALHFVEAGDAHWMVRHLARRSIARAAGRRRELGINEAALTTARRVLARALAGRRLLARPEVYALLERAGVRTSGQRGIHIVGHLAQEGLLCVGPHEGKQPTFALLEDWVRPRRGPRDRDAALADLARRYVMSHGPATENDFSWWAGITRAEARSALARAKGIAYRDEFWTHTSGRPHRPAWHSPTAHLLPAFDEFAVAYKDRSAALARVASVASHVNPQIGLLSPAIVVDGQVVGTWGRTIGEGVVRVGLRPFIQWTPAESDAVAAGVERYAAFLGMDLRFYEERGRKRPRPR
ncbi:MAG: winged helix DNA-binding domain-containing protein [Thermoplasmatota archaeon]